MTNSDQLYVFGQILAGKLALDTKFRLWLKNYKAQKKGKMNLDAHLRAYLLPEGNAMFTVH